MKQLINYFSLITLLLTAFKVTGQDQDVPFTTQKEDCIEVLPAGYSSSAAAIVQPGKTTSFQKISPLPLPKIISFAGETVPLDRPDVREALHHELTVNAFRHSNTLKILRNIDRWRPLVLGVLKEQNVPEDFIYLAIIESEFDNNAKSPVGAMGMWQLMEETAKEFKLQIGEDFDMRRDPKLATVAACQFLKKANSNFNSWVNTAASYNVGIKGMTTRLADQKVNSFFDLFLNPETARYVYRIIALKIIVENPEAYGFFVTEEEKYKPYKFTTITITEDINNLVDFSRQHNCSYKELRTLNPWFNNTTTFSLRVPKCLSFEMRIPVK